MTHKGRASQVCRACGVFPVFDDEDACPRCGTPPIPTVGAVTTPIDTPPEKGV